MCQSKVEKEDIFINQNAAAGANQATMEHFKFHVSAISIVLIVICAILLMGVVYIVYKVYKKCHENWMRDQINTQMLRRSFNRRPVLPSSCNGCGRIDDRSNEFAMK